MPEEPAPLTLDPWTPGTTRWTAIAHIYGDNVDTDVLYPGRHLAITDTAEMAKHAAEDLDPTFRDRVQSGDVFIAGRNLGCGSSREQAAIALHASGIRAIVCGTAARIFFRNAINQGLPVLRLGNDQIQDVLATIQNGDPVTIDLDHGRIEHIPTRNTWTSGPLPEPLRPLITDGGLLPHLKKRLADRSRTDAA